MSAKPGPGAAKKGTAVAMTVSKGRKPVEVPDFTGKSAETASRELSDLGLKVDATKQENSDTVPKGRVISQSPRDGTLFRGDTVTLVVSRARSWSTSRTSSGSRCSRHARRWRPRASRSPCRRRWAGSSAPCACRTRRRQPGAQGQHRHADDRLTNLVTAPPGAAGTSTSGSPRCSSSR